MARLTRAALGYAIAVGLVAVAPTFATAVAACGLAGVATWSLTARSARRLATTMVSMAAGAFLGDWMLSHAHRYAPVVPAVVTAVVIAIAWIALKPRATSGPAGKQGLPVQQAVK